MGGGPRRVPPDRMTSRVRRAAVVHAASGLDRILKPASGLAVASECEAAGATDDVRWRRRVVLGLSKYHAEVIGDYDFTTSSRFGWAFAYIGLLCLAAYGLGLPELPRTLRSRFPTSLWPPLLARSRYRWCSFSWATLCCPDSSYSVLRCFWRRGSI